MRVEWPMFKETRASANVLKYNRPNNVVLSNLFGISDDGRLLCADYTNINIQNGCYEEYTTFKEVTSIFAFNFNGERIHAALNFPGRWYDSCIIRNAGLIDSFLKILWSTARGSDILCSLAFEVECDVDDKIVRSRKMNEQSDVYNGEIDKTDFIVQRELHSKRQSAKWEIRVFRSLFVLLSLPMSHDLEMLQQILLVWAQLYNPPTRQVGMNQIRSVNARKGEHFQAWTVK